LAVLKRIHPEDRLPFEELLNRAVRDKSDFKFEYRIVLPDGAIKLLRSVGQPQISPAEELEYIGTVIDTTERKRAEEAWQEAQAQLAHVTRVNEVNQPLAAIINNANACLCLLPSDTTELDDFRGALSDIISDAERASAVIARIRGLAKKAPPQKSRLNLNETIGEVIALARSELNRNGVLLRIRLANDLPPIMGDRIQLQQVILNLVINAVQAMSGLRESPRELSVSSEKMLGIPDPAAAGPSAGVLVSVADSGPGLHLNNLDRLFDAFYTTKPQGLGMGLAISRSIIEAHGGRLWATANVPKGALFQFTLPW
jgi:signal transduction histidine kinase